MNPLPRLHLITDDVVLADPRFPDTAERVLECCGRTVALHVRAPSATGAQLHAIAARLQTAALRAGAWLLVNDRVDVAMAVRANGVQLGARSLPVADARALLGTGARIGCSVHGVMEALQAEGDGADFVVLGTIFESASHAGRAAAGTRLVRDAATRTVLPVIAIGGITPARIADVADAGAHGAAVLGGLWRAGDPAAAAADYVAAAQAAWPQQNSDDLHDGRTR
ncbi:MAG TPA: thiamine phosphate synthase [Longimicrobiales bacterium]|nr:thiamine phosphate synthase [Longimicrobiales bacterium]